MIDFNLDYSINFPFFNSRDDNILAPQEPNLGTYRKSFPTHR